MTDAPLPTVAPEAVAPMLEAAKTVNGSHFLSTVGALEAAGHAIPYQHRKLAEQMRGALPSANIGTAPYVSRADALAAADGLRRAGVSAERVAAALADHGIAPAEPGAPAIDTTKYLWQSPEGMPIGDAKNLDTNLRSFLGDTGFSDANGSSFGKTLMQTIAQAEAKPELLDTWLDQLTNMLGKEKIEAQAVQIVALLDQLPADHPIVKTLKAGAIRNPVVWVSLANRAAAFAASRSK